MPKCVVAPIGSRGFKTTNRIRSGSAVGLTRAEVERPASHRRIAHPSGGAQKQVLLFEVESEAGWLVARCKSPEMATQAKTKQDLKRMVGELIACHLDLDDPLRNTRPLFRAAHRAWV